MMGEMRGRSISHQGGRGTIIFNQLALKRRYLQFLWKISQKCCMQSLGGVIQSLCED